MRRQVIGSTVILGVTILGTMASMALAQTSVLYLADANSTGTWMVQGGSLIGQFSRQGIDTSAMAIAGDIRTFGQQQQLGHGYDLAGNFNGNTYAHNGSTGTNDGTTDGVNFNYSVTSNSQVWRYDRDWQGGAMLFNAGGNKVGIGFDELDNSFWLADGGAARVYHFDSGGALVSQFQIGASTYHALAFDNADETIWVAKVGSNPCTLKQFSRAGTLLQQFNVDISNGYDGGVIGAEFNIPAPGAASVLGLAGLAAGRRRRSA